MRRLCSSLLILFLGLGLPHAYSQDAKLQPQPPAAEQAVRESALAQMPVKEITVFKDGHAFVLHEGTLPADAAGHVRMDYLPTPVLGTFWPYSSDPQVKLSAVVASRQAVLVERTALDVRELLEANVGSRVIITEHNGTTYHATVAGIPQRSSQELAQTSPPNSDPQLPQKGQLILLTTEEGTKAIAFERIQDVTFRDPPKSSVQSEEFRNLLTLKFAWPDGQAAEQAAVGMAYLQRGIRWIPNYKLTIDGEGNARVQLNATLLNEMTDLNNVTVNLVIGVPTFAFKDTVDPLALQQAAAQLSQYFQEGSQSSYMLSNSMMTQMSRMSEQRVPQAQVDAAAVDLGPEVGDSGKSEDLFIFTVKNVTLKKGERMVLPVTEYTVKYQDVYTLDLPFVPPVEVRQQFDDSKQAELARLLHAPKVMHKIRLKNDSQYPFTTAPALIVHDDRVMAQGMMTYAAIGSSTDLAITAAVDIQVKKTDVESMRAPDAAQWRNERFARIDLKGTITLHSFSREPVNLEVTRYVLGGMDEADHEGIVQQVNAYEEGWQLSGGYPAWWSWYSWPYWWHHFNGIGRTTWKVPLEPGEKVNLGYTWHYYWQ